MGWASSVESDSSSPWPPDSATGLYAPEVDQSHCYGRCASSCGQQHTGCYKTSNMDYGRFYETVRPPMERSLEKEWPRKCDFLQKFNVNCFQELRKHQLGQWPGFTEDFPITSTKSTGKNRGWMAHKVPWPMPSDSGTKAPTRRPKSRGPSPHRRFSSRRYSFF